MAAFLTFMQWALIGLTLVLMYLPFRYEAYLQISLLLLGIILIIPGIEKTLIGTLPILHARITRLTLWLCLCVVAIASFLAIPHATSEDRIEQGIAQLTLHDLMRSQQIQYLESGQFILPSYNPNHGSSANPPYHYDVVIQNTDRPSVKITATASDKRPLKSYTGAVFQVGTGTEMTSMKIICETRKPSQTPPDMPDSPHSTQSILTCPSGSRDVTTEMANVKPTP